MKKLILTLILVASQAQAVNLCVDLFQNKTDYLFGLEFTFTNQILVDEGNRNPQDPSLEGNPLKAAKWLKWLDIVKEKCKGSADCTTEMTYDKHGQALAVIFRDEFQFTIGIDSAALEVNATPKSRTGFEKYKDRMSEYVFETALQAGLQPHIRAGQGHIHISTKAFNERGSVLRNFFVDFQNRPEIIYGALGNHLLNSPPLAAQAPAQREQLTKALEELDRGSKYYSLQSFADMISEKVYTQTVSKTWGGVDYYQAFNMTRVDRKPESATIEIRSFRPQPSPEIFELQTILLEKWVEKLKLIDQNIPYINKSKYQYSPQEIVNGFHQLVLDLELPWNTFKVLLPVELQEISPNTSFVSVDYSLKELAAKPKKSFLDSLYQNFF